MGVPDVFQEWLSFGQFVNLVNQGKTVCLWHPTGIKKKQTKNGKTEKEKTQTQRLLFVGESEIHRQSLVKTL